MNAGKIIKKCLIDRDVSQSDLAKRLNVSPQNLTNKLNRGNFLTDDFFKMLEELNYEIRIVDIKKETK